MRQFLGLRMSVLGVLALLFGATALAANGTQAAPSPAEEPGVIVTTGFARVAADIGSSTSTVTIVVTERAPSKEALESTFSTVRDKMAQIRGRLIGGGFGIASEQIRVFDPQVSPSFSLPFRPPLPPGFPGGPTPTPAPPPGATPAPIALPQPTGFSVSQRLEIDVTGGQVEPVVITANGAGASTVYSAAKFDLNSEAPAPAALADAVRRATEQAHAMAPAAAAASQRGLGSMRKVEVHEPVLPPDQFRGGVPLWSIRVTVTYEMAQ